MQQIQTVRGGKSVPIDKIDSLSPTKPLPKSPEVEPDKNTTPAHLPSTDINNVPQKKNIFLIWLLSTITLDIYTSVWYIKKSQEFYNLGTQKRLSNGLPLTLLIINILLITSIVILPLTINEDMGTFYEHISPLQSGLIFAIGILILLKLFFALLLAFYSRSVINQALENKESKTKVSGLFTLIFTHLYLQYEINKIIDDKEDTPKVGPWVFLLIILLLIAAGIVLPMLGINLINFI